MHIFIATPTYDGKVVHEYASSLLATWGDCIINGIQVSHKFIPGVCFVDIARNAAIAAFLQTDATHILFIDADMGWDATAPARMLKRDKDFIGGVYPNKVDEAKFPVRCPTDENGYPIVRDGLIKAEGLPGGFMLIKREAIEKMVANQPVKYAVDVYGLGTVTVPALFTCELKDGRYWGEDYMFCNRWLELGGEIWIEPDINFVHIGTKGYGGNYHQFMLAQPKAAT